VLRQAAVQSLVVMRFRFCPLMQGLLRTSTCESNLREHLATEAATGGARLSRQGLRARPLGLAAPLSINQSGWIELWLVSLEFSVASGMCRRGIGRLPSSSLDSREVSRRLLDSIEKQYELPLLSFDPTSQSSITALQLITTIKQGTC
jgi:hypothetical protein